MLLDLQCLQVLHQLIHCGQRDGILHDLLITKTISTDYLILRCSADALSGYFPLFDSFPHVIIENFTAHNLLKRILL